MSAARSPLGERAIAGAAEALDRLRPFRLHGDTTTRSRRELAAMGLPVTVDDVLTPAQATAAHLRRMDGGSLFLVSPGAREDLAGLAEGADHVVMGDGDAAQSRAGLTAALRALQSGADLIAMARNRWFLSADGPVVDVQCTRHGLRHPWPRVWRTSSWRACGRRAWILRTS